MTNTVAAIVLSVWTVLLAVLGEREKTKLFARRANICTAAAGAVLLALSGIASAAVAARLPEGSGREWTVSIIVTFFAALLTLFVLLFAVCAVTSLISRKNEKLSGGLAHKLRVAMIAISSIFILVTSYLAYIAAAEEAPLEIYLIAGGAGLACLMRLCALIEKKTEINR